MTTTELPTPATARPDPPLAARWATLLWLVAVGAGVTETVITVTGALSNGASWSGLMGQVALRAVIYGALFVVIDRYFRRGRPCSRWFLTLALGVLGLATLLIGPIQWLTQGADFNTVVWTPAFITFAAVRALHVLAVLGALSLTHHPETARWFKTCRI